MAVSALAARGPILPCKVLLHCTRCCCMDAHELHGCTRRCCMDGGWRSSADLGICQCLWGSASGMATSTVLHLLQLIHPSFGHDHTTSWAWTRHGRWKCPAEIMARIVTSPETACGKNTSPLITSVSCQSWQERFWMSFKSGYLYPIHLMKY